MRLFLILLLALCSRDFLILFEARQTCSVQIWLVSHYAGVFSPNGLVEQRMSWVMKVHGLGLRLGSSLKRSPLRIKHMLRNHFQFRKLLNRKMFGGWASVERRNCIWLTSAFRHPLLETDWKSHPTHLLLRYVAHLSLCFILVNSSANIRPDVFAMLMVASAFHIQVSAQTKIIFCPSVISCQVFSHQLKLRWGSRDLNYSVTDCLLLKLTPAVTLSIQVISPSDMQAWSKGFLADTFFLFHKSCSSESLGNFGLCRDAAAQTFCVGLR